MTVLGERSDQRGLWEADRLYLDHVGTDTFYGLLASLRGRLFRDADFAEFYCADNLQGIYRVISPPLVPPFVSYSLRSNMAFIWAFRNNHPSCVAV